MKYTSPFYKNEALETNDIVCESPYKIAYYNKVIGKDEQGNDITAPATQITVDVSNLF